MLLIEILMTIGFILFLPFFWIERTVHKKSAGWREKLGIEVPQFDGNKIIHIHGCSVGEILAIENLLKSIRENLPECKIIVTTFTLAGQNIAKKKYENLADVITYFPFDTPIAVNRFLSKIKPSISVIVETEIWPYFAYACKKRNIPLCIINARISDSSYSQYKNMKWFFKKVLNNYSAIYAQSLEDKEKFISIGLAPEKAEMMGNLKFDIEAEAENIDINGEKYRIFLAGSTHKPENEIVISTYKKLKNNYPDLKFLIAPRHLERVQEIKDLLQKYELSYGLRSNDAKFSETTDVIILDTLGELKKMYSACDVAFIGGSFNKTGGHNPLEAAIYEKPVASGPSTFNFKDIYEILCKSNAGKIAKTPEELFEYLNKLLGDSEFYNQAKSNCKNVFSSQRGAINFVVSKLKNFISKSQ